MFSLKLKLIAAAVILALIGSLLAAQHFTQKKLNAERRKTQTLEATITAEREARAHEARIAKEASDGFQAELRRIRSEPDIGPVLLCRKPRTVSADSTAATGPDGSSTGRIEEAPEVDPIDVGPQLDDYGTDCEATAAQLTALQGWVKAR